ncbi:MAG: SDR family NAD(P)-dependent oxidoreductase [Pyrinomonadaceae bacterium]|nr:SDR family NAD(P)-dependent oxidoreductase [Pyrinomonadaceae bacterium]
MAEEKKVWFITGSSTGFGKEMAKQALERGHKVAATARDVSTLSDLSEQYPESVKAITLDVTKQSDIENSIKTAIEAFGGIDVLVNNAGYGLGGGIEEPSIEQIRAQYETNLFGVINMMREVLPHFRDRKSGHVLNVSSVVGLVSWPSIGYYSSTKFAMEALSEALAGEVEHLGIKVTIVEPGGFRTDFAGRSFVQPANRIEDYLSSERIDNIGEFDGAQPGDPVKAIKAIIDVVESENPPLRLPLGEDAVTAIDEKLEAVRKNVDEMRDVAINTKVEEDQAESAGN